MRKVVSGLFISLDGVVEAPYCGNLMSSTTTWWRQWAHILLRKTPSSLVE